jgi:hypothetical protein
MAVSYDVSVSAPDNYTDINDLSEDEQFELMGKMIGVFGDM